MHLHVIAEGAYLPATELSAAWHKITGDSFVVDVRSLKSGKDAAYYVSKYVTKGTSVAVWHNIDTAQEWVTATKGVRICSTYGDWRGTAPDRNTKDGGRLGGRRSARQIDRSIAIRGGFCVSPAHIAAPAGRSRLRRPHSAMRACVSAHHKPGKLLLTTTNRDRDPSSCSPEIDGPRQTTLNVATPGAADGKQRQAANHSRRRPHGRLLIGNERGSAADTGRAGRCAPAVGAGAPNPRENAVTGRWPDGVWSGCAGRHGWRRHPRSAPLRSGCSPAAPWPACPPPPAAGSDRPRPIYACGVPHRSRGRGAAAAFLPPPPEVKEKEKPADGGQGRRRTNATIRRHSSAVSIARPRNADSRQNLLAAAPKGSGLPKGRQFSPHRKHSLPVTRIHRSKMGRNQTTERKPNTPQNAEITRNTSQRNSRRVDRPRQTIE